MRLSVVIPTWNAWVMLEETLTALQTAIQAIAPEVEVIVVDDGGVDDTCSRLQKDYSSWVKLVQREKNGGFSAACNSGIAAASGEWVLLLNNDMVPEKNAVEMLLDYAESCAADVFAVRPAIARVKRLEADDYAHMAMQIHRERGMLRFFIVRLAASTAHSQAFPVCSGGAGLFRREMLHTLGGFDEIFSPFYWEDTDLSYRALIRGWRNLYFPQALFLHAETGSIKKHFRPASVERTSQRNAYLFHWLNISDKKLLLQHLLWIPLHLIRGLAPQQHWRILAFFDALARFPQVREGRKKRLLQRIQTDQAVIAQSNQGVVTKIWVQ